MSHTVSQIATRIRGYLWKGRRAIKQRRVKKEELDPTMITSMNSKNTVVMENKITTVKAERPQTMAAAVVIVAKRICKCNRYDKVSSSALIF